MNTDIEIKLPWEDFSSGLRLFILSKVRNDSDADDILQEIYLRIHENIHTLKNHSSLKPWVYQIARNMITDYYRTSKSYGGQYHMQNLSSSSSADKLMDTAVNDMIKMMDKLSPEYCEALCLIEIEGMSQKEYAERKGLSYSGAKSRVQRARALLKELLLRCCHYQFDKYGTVIDIHPRCCCCKG